MQLPVDEREHSLEMHLPYIQQVMGDTPYLLVPIMVGALSEAFDCVPPTAPMLDVVPLLPAAGWTPQAVGALGDVDAAVLLDGAMLVFGGTKYRAYSIKLIFGGGASVE